MYAPFACSACGGQKKGSDPLNLELQVVLSRLVYVLTQKLPS